MMRVKELIRPHVAKLQPYSTARDDFAGEARIFLDANENPNVPEFQVPVVSNLNRYPDPYSSQVRRVAAETAGVAAENCVITNGSDEAIELLLKASCVPGSDFVLIAPPTYGMYRVAAAVQALPVVEVPLQSNWQLNVPAVQAAMNEHPVKVCIFCSPNNPTGNLISSEDILEITSLEKCLVVVDEAYIDFAAPGKSLVPYLAAHENLVVLQTFSKAWGLAGLRAGKIFAHQDLISALLKIKAPYNVNALTQHLVYQVITNERRMKDYTAENQRERRALAAQLGALAGVEEVFPSDANFLLVRFSSAQVVFHHLLSRGIIVRDRAREHGCSGCLRITVGTPEENKLLVEALKECL